MNIFGKALRIALGEKKYVSCRYFLILINHFLALRQLRYSGNVLKVKPDNVVQIVATPFLPTDHKEWENSQNVMTFDLTSGHSRSKVQVPITTLLAHEILSKDK